MKPLLLLHGAMGSQDQFDNLVPLLSPYFDLYRFNFSGHGGRPASASFGITTFTEEVIRFMNDHHLRETDIFGFGDLEKCTRFSKRKIGWKLQEM